MCGKASWGMDAGVRRLAAGSCLILAGLSAQQVLASSEITYDNCDLAGADTVVAHVTGTFNPDAKIYDLLTDWIEIPHQPGWTCTRYSNLPLPGLPMPTLSVALRTHVAHHVVSRVVDGVTYSVYKSYPETPHTQYVGHIMRRRMVIRSGGNIVHQTPWLPLVAGNANIAVTPYNMPLANNAVYTVSVESEVRLVKLTATSPASNFPRTGEPIEFQVAEFRYQTQAAKPGHASDHESPKPWKPPTNAPKPQVVASRPKRYSRVRVWFNRLDKTCSTQSSAKTVYLPTVAKSAFTGMGSTAGTVGFNLELFDCKPGIASIEYKLVPSYLEPSVGKDGSTWATDNSNGTLALSKSSTATGVRVQVLDGNGDPVTFDRESRLVANGYSTGMSSLQIPLQARYIQTGDTITAGRVHATMVVLYMYK